MNISRGDIFWVEPDGTVGSVPGIPHPQVGLYASLIGNTTLCRFCSLNNRCVSL